MKIQLSKSNVEKIDEFFEFYGENPKEFDFELVANTMLSEIIDVQTGHPHYTWKRDREIMLDSYRKTNNEK